jgi:dTDP-4-dehydrorhamnose reductase
MRLPSDQIGNPTYAPDLAEAVIQLAGLGASGIYNVVGRDRLSRYEFARAAARLFGLDERLLVPTSTAQLGQVAARPLDAGLTVDKVESALKRPMLGYLAGLQEMVAMREAYNV